MNETFILIVLGILAIVFGILSKYYSLKFREFVKVEMVKLDNKLKELKERKA